MSVESMSVVASCFKLSINLTHTFVFILMKTSMNVSCLYLLFCFDLEHMTVFVRLHKPYSIFVFISWRIHLYR